MSEQSRQPRVNRRDLIKLTGAAALAAGAAVSGGPRISFAQQAAAKSAVIMGPGVPFTLWTGIRFWTNSGIPGRMLFEPLLDIDDKLMPAPGLVEKWEAVSNTLSRYHLRSGVKWSDGTPLTAKDVVFSMNLTFNKDLATLMSTEISTIKGGDDVKAGTATSLSGVRAVDDQTVEIETAIPDTSIVRTLALRWWAPIPQHVYESIKPADLMKSAQLTQPPVISGPFKIDRIEPDKWFEMSANSGYWRGKPKLDKITYIFGNVGDVVALGSQQKFDYYVARQPDITTALSQNPNYTVKTVEYIQPYRRQFNASMPKFSDPRMRKAVAYAIDRETLCKDIYQGGATPQYTDFQGDLLDPSAEIYKYDPDHARELLKQANWNPNDVVHFEATATPAGQTPDPIAEAEFAAYQQWLGDIGIKVDQRIHPDSASYATFTESDKFDSYENPHRRYDMYGPLELKTYLLSEPPNYAKWKNAQVDELVHQALATTDQQAYIALCKKMSVIVADQCPYVPTRAAQWGIVARKGFTGYTPIGEAYFAFAHPYDWDMSAS